MMKSMIVLGLAALAAAAATRVVADDANPPTEHAVLAQRLDLAKGERHAFAVHAPKLPPGRHPYLFFRAAAQSANPAGYCNRAIQVLVNDQPIDAQRLSNRPSTATMLNGHVLTIAQGNGCFLIPWGPDFTATDRDPTYGLIEGVKACEYELYLGDLLREGENAITLVNTNTAGLGYTVLLGDVEYRVTSNPPGGSLLKPAPTGPLPVIVPQSSFPKTYGELRRDEATITLAIRGREYAIRSRFSTPDGGWATGGNKYFEHRREVVEHDEWIEVRDTFVNKTGENLPIIQEHVCAVGAAATGVWLAGTKMPTGSGTRADGANPSAYAATERRRVGPRGAQRRVPRPRHDARRRRLHHAVGPELRARARSRLHGRDGDRPGGRSRFLRLRQRGAADARGEFHARRRVRVHVPQRTGLRVVRRDVHRFHREQERELRGQVDLRRADPGGTPGAFDRLDRRAAHGLPRLAQPRPAAVPGSVGQDRHLLSLLSRHARAEQAAVCRRSGTRFRRRTRSFTAGARTAT